MKAGKPKSKCAGGTGRHEMRRLREQNAELAARCACLQAQLWQVSALAERVVARLAVLERRRGKNRK